MINPCAVNSTDWKDFNPSHCYRCHYIVACGEIETAAKYYEERGETPNFIVCSWWMSMQAVYSGFCLQWPLVAWAMILGKE